MSHIPNSKNTIAHWLAVIPMAFAFSIGLILSLSPGVGLDQDWSSLKARRLAQAGSHGSFFVTPSIKAGVEQAYGELPLSFEANRGQTDERVKFLARGPGYILFLTPDEMLLTLRQVRSHKVLTPRQQATKRFAASKMSSLGSAVVGIKLVGSNPKPQIAGLDPRASMSHYLVGQDRQKWRTEVPHYGKVKYREVYPGVEVTYYGKGQQLEYDFVVAAGADPGVIKLSFSGVEQMEIDNRGDLIIAVADGGQLRHTRPFVYQEIAGVKTEIASHYVLRKTLDFEVHIGSSYEVGIEVGHYDTSRALVIDPELDYSTYLGGSSEDVPSSIAVDGKGNAYVTGITGSTTDFPTKNPFQPNFGGPTGDAFVTKLSRNGQELVYSTYLGGSDEDFGLAIAVDTKGNPYITGYTSSNDFPTEKAFQKDFGQGPTDAFVTKLSRNGEKLVYSTYLGGSDFDIGRAVTVDSKGSAYLTGQTDSTDIPANGTVQPINAGAGDAFVAKMSRNGKELVYFTYLGGSGAEIANGIAVDSYGNTYVTGVTESANFPTKNALQELNAGDADAFLTKLDREGERIVYSTYLGGSARDEGSGVAVDNKANAYVTGSTQSTDFPTKDAFQEINSGGLDVFVTKLDRGGQDLEYSTYLGGSGTEFGRGVAVNHKGRAYVTGETDSTNFPTANAFQAANAGDADAFVTMVSRNGEELTYSTYLGGGSRDSGSGIAVDRNGDAFVVGSTISTDFPIKEPFQFINAGATDAFVAKIGRGDDDD